MLTNLGLSCRFLRNEILNQIYDVYAHGHVLWLKINFFDSVWSPTAMLTTYGYIVIQGFFLIQRKMYCCFIIKTSHHNIMIKKKYGLVLGDTANLLYVPSTNMFVGIRIYKQVVYWDQSVAVMRNQLPTFVLNDDKNVWTNCTRLNPLPG